MERSKLKTIYAEFNITDGKKKELLEAADSMLEQIKTQEDGTWFYLVSTRLDEHTGQSHLVTIEGYANEEAFEQHIAPNTAWSNFASQAKENGWLETDPNNATGLKVLFGQLDHHGSMVRSSGKIGAY